MKTFLKQLALVITLGFLASCQDVVDLDVPTSEPNIVINGRVTDTKGTQVTVSVTADYFSQQETPKIDSAKVFLFENDTMVTELRFDSAGVYNSGFNGSLGNRYHVLVEIPENEPNFKQGSWRSSSELLKPTVELDSFKVKFLRRPEVFEEGFYAQAYFQELPGSGDFYRIIRWRNDSLITQDISVTDDVAIDGFYFGGEQIPAFAYTGPLEKVGDSLGLEISSISEGYFNFLNLIIAQVFQVGSTFDPPPAPVIGNIYNVDDPEQYGFGYFAASSLATGGVTYKQ